MTKVIIGGAGPAGATAAFFLARSGVDVLLVDQATFPRYKTCGDGLGSMGMNMLAKMGLIEWVTSNEFNEITHVLTSSPNGNFIRTRPDPTISTHNHVVPRIELDARLVETAVRAGARLMQGTRITGMERLGADRVRLMTKTANSAETLQAPLLIAADGGQASFTRRLGLDSRAPEHVAMRAYYDGDVGDPRQIELHWDKSILPGYGWVFPLGGGRANVGVGLHAADVRRLRLNLRNVLATFVEKNPHAQARLKHATRVGAPQGHPIRTDAQSTSPYLDNVMIVGEAAGLVNPLTGEGIGPAMISGEIAAHYALCALESGDFLSNGLAAYGRAIRRRFIPRHYLARFACSLMSQAWLVNRAVWLGKVALKVSARSG